MDYSKAIEIFNKWMDCKDAYQADPSCDGRCHSCEYITSAEEEKEAMRMAIAALEKQEKDKWRPVSDGMPEEHKWMGTEHFGTTISDEVYVTVEVPSGERITKHMHFQNGAIPPFEQRNINTFYKGGKAVAWRPLHEPYQEDKA